MPCILFAKEISAAYPDAKLILSTRDTPLVWQKSTLSTTHKMAYVIAPEPSRNPFKLLYRFLRPKRAFDTMVAKLIPAADYASVQSRGQEMYLEHCEMVRTLAREQGRELLEFNVKEGWEPLCKFLGKEVPETPFPRTNEQAEFARNLEKFERKMTLGVAMNALKYLSPMAAVACAVWVYRRR